MERQRGREAERQRWRGREAEKREADRQAADNGIDITLNEMGRE